MSAWTCNLFCLWQLYHMRFLFAIYSIYFFNVLRFKIVTVHSVRSNLVKMHSKSPSVMAFCPVCLGILPYSWQNTSRDITCEQLPIFFLQKQYNSENCIFVFITLLFTVMFPVYTKQIKSARVLPLLLKHVIIILFLPIH